MPEYVERSYHEALINALAHRDYTINGSEIHIDIYDDRMELYSPGGMPDGSFIQDRDPLTIPSTRRKPILADVLNRLGYMERKGSGFEKILSGYEFQLNYDESKKPRFRSDRYQFTVVMPKHNLIVLDEPTAAIDPLEESAIYEQFKDIVKDNTAVLVTHRIGSAQIADRIIVMSKGSIIDSGTHQELLKRCEEYSNMYYAQADLYCV